MSTYAIRHAARDEVSAAGGAREHLLWMAAGLALGFLVPFVLADLLDLPRDLYYGIYSVFAVGLFALWARSTGQSLEAMARRRWLLALGLGAAFAGVMALVVLRTEDSTARPEGLELVGAVIWRGVVYGIADGVLLSAFPILLVFAAFGSSPLRRRLVGKLAIGLAALAASVAMTAVYHLGYADFRSAKVRSPVAGDVLWSIPTLVTLNPVAAPVAHAGLHVTAVLHSYETDLFLPPHE
jgi:hypothetical protein